MAQRGNLDGWTQVFYTSRRKRLKKPWETMMKKLLKVERSGTILASLVLFEYTQIYDEADTRFP